MMRERKWVLISVILVLAAGSLAYYLFVSERARQAALEEEATRPIDLQSTLIEEQSSGLVSVKLYFYDGQQLPDSPNFLRVETREIHEVSNPVLMARQILVELFKVVATVAEAEGEGGEVASAGPEPPVDGIVRQVFLLDDGTAVVDLSSQVIGRLSGGILSELAILQAMTRSLRENLPQVERVRFLVEGKQRRTLAGHISLQRTFM